MIYFLPAVFEALFRYVAEIGDAEVVGHVVESRDMDDLSDFAASNYSHVYYFTHYFGGQLD